MMMLPDPLAAGQLEEESTVEAAVGAEVDVLDNCRLAQPGLTQPAGKTLVLAAGRLAIDEQPKPIFATEFAGIGSILQFDKGISHGSEAERAQAFDGGVEQHCISLVSGSSWGRECSRGSAAVVQHRRPGRVRDGCSEWRRPRCRIGCQAPARERRPRWAP